MEKRLLQQAMLKQPVLKQPLLQQPLLQQPLLYPAIWLASFTAAAIFIVWLLQPVLVPLLLSCVLYSLLEPLTSRLVAYRYSQTMAITLVLLGLLAVIALLLTSVAPLLVRQLEQLQNHFPQILQSLDTIVHSTTQWLRDTLNMNISQFNVADQWLSHMQSWGATAVMSSAGFVLQTSMIAVLVPLITFFLLRDYRKIRNQALGLLPNSRFELGWITYHRVTQQLQSYVKGVVTESLIMAVITTVGFYLVGLDMAILFGCLTGLLNIIPYVGPLIAASLPVFVIITTGSPDVWLIIGVIGVVLLAQLIDNVVVIPAVIAGSIGLHPLVVLFGVIIAGSLFGILGMLLAIPALASAKIIAMGLMHDVREPRAST